MKGKRVEGEMHMKASADLERSVEKDMEAKDTEGKSLTSSQEIGGSTHDGRETKTVQPLSFGNGLNRGERH